LSAQAVLSPISLAEPASPGKCKGIRSQRRRGWQAQDGPRRTSKPILRSDPSAGSVIVDADTQIMGIPRESWDYRLGNRSAIDWVLDQHREKKPRDPNIAAKFNTYRFADFKESMIALLAKVARMSVETVAITEAMKAAERDPAPDQVPGDG
jgi:predicted helicase